MRFPPKAPVGLPCIELALPEREVGGGGGGAPKGGRADDLKRHGGQRGAQVDRSPARRRRTALGPPGLTPIGLVAGLRGRRRQLCGLPAIRTRVTTCRSPCSSASAVRRQVGLGQVCQRAAGDLENTVLGACAKETQYKMWKLVYVVIPACNYASQSRSP